VGQLLLAFLRGLSTIWLLLVGQPPQGVDDETPR
jgi:hypothetical protein